MLGVLVCACLGCGGVGSWMLGLDKKGVLPRLGLGCAFYFCILYIHIYIYIYIHTYICIHTTLRNMIIQ